MGSPETEKGRQAKEAPQYRRIHRSVAVGTKEVSITQFREFKPNFKPDRRYAPTDSCPANVSWYDAVAYCNWLSEQEGLVLCYPKEIRSGMNLEPAAIERGGYRLPTEAEWEYFCRARTETSRPFGESEELLPRYAWTWLNSNDVTHPPGERLPNEFGLFDVLGNMYEWCHDGQPKDGAIFPAYPAGTKEHPAVDDDPGREDINDGTWRILRGGAFDYAPATARSADRYGVSLQHHEATLGFRVVRTIAPEDRR
jgi:formylglycine-generating enzyme required for sulfatase activity